MVSAFPASGMRKVLARPTAHGWPHMFQSKADPLPEPALSWVNAFERVSAPTPPWQMGNCEMRFISGVCSSCGLMVEASETGRARAPGGTQWSRPPALY